MRGTVDGNRWTDLFQSLPPPARLATVGAAGLTGSMLFPWYSIQFGPGLSQTGFDTFGLGELALVLTAAAALYLIVRCATGYRLARPLSQGGLLTLAGTWATILVVYLMIDRPDDIAGHTNIHLRYGIFVALIAALALLVGGLRLRKQARR